MRLDPTHVPSPFLLLGTLERAWEVSDHSLGFLNFPCFLTVVNGTHDSYIWHSNKDTGFKQVVATDVDWMRYAIYGDNAAKGRLLIL